MKKTSPTIVFFGSGPVAATSLRLLRESFVIEGVVTKPRPAHHRSTTPVVDLCEEHNIPYITAENKAQLSAVVKKHGFNSPMGVVIDFGIIIHNDVINSFELGIVNSHFSLLPEWRGADPISFAILSGQKTTGVSIMLIDEKMDEGPLLAQSFYNLPVNITTPELTETLISISDATLKEILPLYYSGQIDPIPQDIISVPPTYSRKLTKQDGTIDWQKSAEQIEREIRAYIDWPKSRTTIAGKDVIIKQAAVVKNQGKPGTHKVVDKELLLYCGKDALKIEVLQPAGKQPMPTAAFLAGHQL